MTIQQALQTATKNLAKKTATASLDAEVLLCSIVKKTKAWLYAHSEKKLSAAHARRFANLIRRRCSGEPIAYLINYKAFYGLDFYVDKRVLIPRPETELIVDILVEKARNQELGIRNQKFAIADVGTGSGAIIIALAKTLRTIRHKPFAIRYYGTDSSRAALTVAKKNARQHRVKIHWQHSSLLEPLAGTHIDILVANLPYLTAAQYRQNLTLRFEPRAALVAGEKGLRAYRQLFEQMSRAGTKPQLIIIEIDPRQTRAITTLARRAFPSTNVLIKKDLAGRDRLAVINHSTLIKRGSPDRGGNW